MTTTEDMSGIVDMDASGNVLTPEPARGLPPATSTAPDPPGVHRLFVDADDAGLSAELRQLRAEQTELGAHAGHTREEQRDRVDEKVRWAKGRITTLDAEFAVTLDRNPAAYPSPEHATLRMMAEPAWAKGVKAAIDAKPACLRAADSPELQPPRPNHEQVSCFTKQELDSLRRTQQLAITEHESELRLRAQRRITHRAQAAERELEASLTTTKGTTR